jgi:hypothetical protein
VAYDPCGLLPDTAIPAGTSLHTHSHAIHHVIGRIRHRVRPHVLHPAKPARSATNLDGCERHATASMGHGQADGGSTLLRTISAGPGLAAISGAGGALIGGFGGYVTGRATKQHTHHGSHDGGGSTPVPEPSSVVVFLTVVLVCLAARRILARVDASPRGDASTGE